MKITSMKKMASVVGLLLSLVSAIFTIKLLTVFGNTGFERMLYGLFGGCIQAAQTLCYIYAAICIWRGKPASAIPGLIVFGLLFFLSLLGTIGFFSVNNKQMAMTATQESPEMARMTTQLENLNAEIEKTQGVIDDCQKRMLLTKCVVPQTEQLERLQAERAELMATVNEFKKTPASDGVYEMIGAFFGVDDPERIKFIIYVLYSVALDLTSVILLAYSVGWLNFNDKQVAAEPAQARQTRQFVQTAEPAQARHARPFVQAAEPAQARHARPFVQAAEPAHARQTRQFVQAAEPAHARQTDSGKRTIGFVQGSFDDMREKSAEPDVQAVISDYIETAFAYAKPDSSLAGRKVISDKLNITNRLSEKCHRTLKNGGLVRVEGKKTYPNCGKEQMLAALG